MESTQDKLTALTKTNPALWDDGDLTVSEESSDTKPAQLPNLTKQFTNTLKDNKGHLRPDSLSEFCIEKRIVKHSSARNIQNDSIEKELEISFAPEEHKGNLSQEISSGVKGRKVTASTFRSEHKRLCDLRKTPSCEILKKIL
ncbi:unnamed protein product [Moneuplotes crassus]|uniref:Uncharacterized protein n=1 Tax=Euplotes crassus TaxID=5936 RepID=A0AAD1UMJ6_EUPCR|nr:unnamed protein product [Moneuplotes crassus]